MNKFSDYVFEISYQKINRLKRRVDVNMAVKVIDVYWSGGRSLIVANYILTPGKEEIYSFARKAAYKVLQWLS